MSNKNVFRETKIHGRLDFPYIVYMGKIPDFLRTYPLHWHEEFEIIWIQEGCGNFQVLSQNFLCSSGDILVIPPNCIHDMKQFNSEKVIYFNILFKFQLLEQNENSNCYKKYFQPFLEDNNFQTYLKNGSPINQRLTPLIKNLVEHRKEKYETQELMVKAKLFEIMFDLQETILTHSLKVQKNNSQIARLKPILKHISENFDQDISVESAAELCAMSPTYFMKFFKKITGVTFVTYLNQVRLENAQTLLRTTNLSVSQIAENCGFRNFSYFIRTFKKLYGKTPNNYRK